MPELIFRDGMKSPAGHKCDCGKEHKWPAYVYAHYHERLTHTCDVCGRKVIVLSGHVFSPEDSI